MASSDLDYPWSSSAGESFYGSFNIRLEEDNPIDILPVLEVPSFSVSSKCNIPKPPSLRSKSCIRIKYSNRLSECSSVPKETKDTWDKLFKEGYGSDVYIIIEDKSYTLAHSNILSVASPVLGNILQQSKVKNGGYGVAIGGPLAWGLCYNKELSPDSLYSDEYYKLTYPRAPGAAYYGRGALSLYWNYNYGKAGEALKVDLLNHPEYIEQNATLAFQAAIWRWMTPVKKNQPSAHDVFVGNWKRTKNDTLAKRVPGFGTTMNILYGDSVCGQGDSDSMNNIVSHYQYYLDLMGVGREKARPHEVLTCSEQLAFNPSSSSSTS